MPQNYFKTLNESGLDEGPKSDFLTSDIIWRAKKKKVLILYQTIAKHEASGPLAFGGLGGRGRGSSRRRTRR